MGSLRLRALYPAFWAATHYGCDPARLTLIGSSDRSLNARQASFLTNSFNRFMNLLSELLVFLRAKKKLWLFPIILVMVALGGLLVAAQGSILAPFIYTLF